jgi:hypothetical protein
LLLISNVARANIAENLLPGDPVITEKGCGRFIEYNLLGATVLLDDKSTVLVGACKRSFSLLKKAKLFTERFRKRRFSAPKQALGQLSEMRTQSPERLRFHLVQEYGLRSRKDLEAAMQLLKDVAQMDDGNPSRADKEHASTLNGSSGLVP